MNHNLPRYPQPISSRKMCVSDHYGPHNYQTGGEQLTGVHFGMESMDVVVLPTPAFTLSGLYSISQFYPSGSGRPVGSMTLIWYDVETALEVASGTDLSDEQIRLQVVGG